MSRSELNISRWLEAHSDQSAGLTTLPGNAILADIAGERDYRLVLIDLKLANNSRCRMKMYKGTVLTSDQGLPDIPSCLIAFYTDNLEPKVPAIAVACNSVLLIYKNNKPFYKFTVPVSPLVPLEVESWKKFEDSCTNIEEVFNDLKTIPFSLLSPRSQELLSLPPNQINEFIGRYVGTQLIKLAPITAMSTLNRNSTDKFAAACPVLGTETGNIFILDPQAFLILHQATVCNIKSTPSIIRTLGVYDVEFRIVIACRENNVCLLRRGWIEGKSFIQLTDNIVDMVLIPGDNFIVLATSNKLLHCYTKRGQRLWSTEMINYITCLCLIPLKHLSTHLTAVGLKGGAIHLYHGRHAVDYTSTPDTPSTIIFGQLGQEEHVMIIVTLSGTISFKILKRTADFDLSDHNRLASPTVQSKPLPLPKRSKLFLEQSMREKQNAMDMHQTFQQDLVKLRLRVARVLVQNLSDQSGIGNEQEQIKVSAQVLGLGPKFTLILTLENMNMDKVVVGFSIVFHANPSYYILSSYINKVPLIPPGLAYKMEIKVTEILDENLNQLANSTQIIKVFVNRRGQTQPVLAATINMPPTEMVPLI